MSNITADDVRKMIARYLAGTCPTDIGRSFNTDGSNVRYHLAKSSNLWVIQKLRDEALSRANGAKATASKNKWNAIAEKYAARIAYLRANHRSQPTSD